MARSGADLGCCGPFVRGVTGTDSAGGCFAECCGYMCPPDCCDELQMVFECGVPSDPDCCVNPIYINKKFNAKTDDVEYDFPIGPAFSVPSFRKQRIRSRNNLFALGDGNCPCVQIIVNLHVQDMCCLEIDGPNIWAVGSGFIWADISPAPQLCCLGIEMTINGFPPPIYVEDGDRVVVNVTSNNCACCMVSMTDPCAPYGEPLWIPIPDEQGGKASFILNRSEALRRINMIKIKRVRNSLKRMFAERGINRKVSSKDVRNTMNKLR